MSEGVSPNLSAKLANIPESPGVYLYRDTGGKIIYVGKAKSLRHRVRSYFQESRHSDFKLDFLRAEIDDLEFIVVANEMEALALENNLIKQHKPKYNILLRDDKTYPFIKLTVNEKYPRLFVTRRLKQDGAVYYGPYFPTSLAYKTMKLICRHFQIRTCSLTLDGNRPRVCLDYHIKRCMGPCVASICSQEAYASRVQDLKLFMEGKRTDLLKRLKEKMQAAAAAEQFELAAHLRDTLRTIQQLSEPQRISSSRVRNVDILALHHEGARAAAQLFHLRNGQVVDRRGFFWENLPERLASGEVFSSLMKQYYVSNPEITPDEIYVPWDFEDRTLVEDYLSQRGGRRVEIAIPQRGSKKDLVELAVKNAKISFDQRFRLMQPNAAAIAENLASLLGVEPPLRRIECFDISNIQGTDSVASMVVWEEGRMKKSDYRKFIIKTVEGPDDFKSMHEVILRRYKRVRDEGRKLPDLVLVDGGIGQLHAAAAALEELDLPTQPLASIAKREEIIYVRGSEEDPIQLDKHSPSLHLIQQIRDETHRFALTFHRLRRTKRTLTSDLLKIRGVGEKTSRALLQKFGSLRAIGSLSLEELALEVPRPRAKRIYDFFHP
ncbi:MAG: excinuclease ABC subunit UvrC [Terriglobia bacterium]